MRKVAFVLLGNLLFVAPVIWAQSLGSATDANVEREVLETQERRFQAMIDVDAEVLENILSGDLTYTHTSGWMETKEEFIFSLRSQSIKYKSIKPTDLIIRIYSDTAVVTGVSEMGIIFRNKPMEFSIRFIEVYRENQGRWQLVAWQSSRIPDE